VAQLARPDVAELEVRIEAEPATVFEFFTDPEKMSRWKGTTADLDPRPGGVYRVGGIAGGATAAGSFVELEPPRRVVFTWGWEGDPQVPPGSSTVEVTLTPDGRGTILRLVHRDLPPGQGVKHLEGWQHFAPRLVVAAAGGDPGPDPWAG
jgi:uncharacterized protein YndB with AHSA1/START domain